MSHECSKTELSLSIIRSLNDRRFVLWFRAGDLGLFREDLVTTALTLRNELLRQTLPQWMGSRADAFYTSYQDQTLRLELLKLWLKTVQDNDSKVLVVLDDLDGLDPKELKEISDIFAGDHLDIIFTTRNPSFAEPGSFLHAAAFEVPPMQPEEASELIQKFMKGNLLTQRGEGGPSQASHVSLTANDSETEVIKCLGALPAAIINASHYIKDNLGANHAALDPFLKKWNSDAGKSEILRSRRSTFRYPHSMHGSFRVSLGRLSRNTGGSHKDLCGLSLTLFGVLSSMDIDEFPQSKIKEWCESLDLFLDNNKDIDFFHGRDLSRLSQEEATVYRCCKELVNVSLLSESEDSGVWILNGLVKACSLEGLSSPVKETFSQAAAFLQRTWAKNSSTNHTETPTVLSSGKAGKRPQRQENGTPHKPQPDPGIQSTLGKVRQSPASSDSLSPKANEDTFKIVPGIEASEWQEHISTVRENSRARRADPSDSQRRLNEMDTTTPSPHVTGVYESGSVYELGSHRGLQESVDELRGVYLYKFGEFHESEPIHELRAPMSEEFGYE